MLLCEAVPLQCGNTLVMCDSVPVLYDVVPVPLCCCVCRRACRRACAGKKGQGRASKGKATAEKAQGIKRASSEKDKGCMRGGERIVRKEYNFLAQE